MMRLSAHHTSSLEKSDPAFKYLVYSINFIDSAMLISSRGIFRLSRLAIALLYLYFNVIHSDHSSTLP